MGRARSWKKQNSGPAGARALGQTKGDFAPFVVCLGLSDFLLSSRFSQFVQKHYRHFENEQQAPAM